MSQQKHRTPSRVDHNQFCETESWKLQPAEHHRTYTLKLADGRILRTRISHPVGRETYTKSMFKHILREQLDCTVDDFFECVDSKVLPPRPTLPNEDVEGVDLSVAMQLRRSLKLNDAEISRLTRAEANQLLGDYYRNLS